MHVAAYIEQLTKARSAPTVKQHLAAIRMCFDWLTSGGVMDFNPASSVRGPKHKVKQGKTSVLTADEAEDLLTSIIPEKKKENTHSAEDATGNEEKEPKPSIAELRDPALIAVMVFSFARVSAALAMKVEDYYTEGRRAWFRLHEKGGKRHKVPAHHNAEKYVDAYLDAAGIAGQKKTPLFRSIDTRRNLTDRPMDRNDALRIIKRRARAQAYRKTSAATPSGPPASPPTSRTAAPSSTPSRSPTTNHRKRPSSTTAPATRSPRRDRED